MAFEQNTIALERNVEPGRRPALFFGYKKHGTVGGNEKMIKIKLFLKYVSKKISYTIPKIKREKEKDSKF